MSSLHGILRSFMGSRVLLLGDLIIDVHHYGASRGVSHEAPVPRGLHQESKVSFGGAGLVARNVLVLGGKLTFVSVVGDDEYGGYYKNFSHKNLHKKFISERGRTTTVKERFVIDGQKMLRWDRLNGRPISLKTEQTILAFIKKNLKQFDKLIISDYRHGLISKRIAQALIREARKQGVPLYVDSQTLHDRGNYTWYKGATLACLNEKEACGVDPSFSRRVLARSLKRLKKALRTEQVIVKLGERGSASLIGRDFFTTPAFRVKAVDAVGAGDAFFAVLALARTLSRETLLLANIWAGLSTTIPGTEPPKRAMLEYILRTNT